MTNKAYWNILLIILLLTSLFWSVNAQISEILPLGGNRYSYLEDSYTGTKLNYYVYQIPVHQSSNALKKLYYIISNGKDSMVINSSNIFGGISVDIDKFGFIDKNSVLRVYDYTFKEIVDFKLSKNIPDFYDIDVVIKFIESDKIIVYSIDGNWVLGIENQVILFNIDGVFQKRHDEEHPAISHANFQISENEFILFIKSDELRKTKIYALDRTTLPYNIKEDFELPYSTSSGADSKHTGYYFFNLGMDFLITDKKGKQIKIFNDVLWANRWQPIIKNQKATVLVYANKHDQNKTFIEVDLLKGEFIKTKTELEFLTSFFNEGVVKQLSIQRIEFINGEIHILISNGISPLPNDNSYSTLILNQEFQKINLYNLGPIRSLDQIRWSKSLGRYSASDEK